MNGVAIRRPMSIRGQWLNWRVVLALFMLVLLVHPALMALSRHERMMAATVASRSAAGEVCIASTCPLQSFCLSAAVAQALPRVPATPITVFALLIALGLVVRWQLPAPAYRSDGFWSPDRHRALLQVFLI